MTAGIRGRRAGIWIFGVTAALILAAASTEAERPDGDRRVLLGAARLDVAKTLGPGPVPSRQGWADRSKDRPKAATIDQCVQTEMARFSAPGAAVAVAIDGQIIYESGYGLKRRGGGLQVEPDTLFRIGSVTKMMTAGALMQQVELGRIDLHAPVTDYIPEFQVGGRWPADRITVWNTLTHTTGFPDRIDNTYLVGDDALSMWAERQSQAELHAPPGSFWNYSNPNFMIAGLVVERASGVPYRDHYPQSLWEPAGMHSTTFDPDEVVATGNYSHGHHYDAQEDRWITLGPRDNDLWVAGPAGFAFSTVGDLVRWALLLTDGGGLVLSPSSADVMQYPHQWTHHTPDLHYGFGIMIEKYQGLDVRQHGGNVAGYGTFVLWVPERRFAVAVLSNVTNSLNRAAYCIVDLVLDPTPVNPPDLSTDPETWKRYVGDYLVTDSEGAKTEATVYLDGDELMGSIVDPEDPATVYTSRLVQDYLDTFLYDSNGDGWVDSDLTFCSTRGEPGFVMWLRNRYAVGERMLTPRTGGRTVAP